MSENQIEGVYPEHGVPILRTEPRRKRLVITRPVRPSFQRGTDPALRQNRKAVSQLTTRSERRSIAFSRSEEHTSELQSLMRISYAVFCLKKKNNKIKRSITN